MSGSIDDLKRTALQVGDAQERLTKNLSYLAGELKKNASSIAGVLGSHKTQREVVEAINDASKAVESAAESCNKSAAATRNYVAQHFGGQ